MWPWGHAWWLPRIPTTYCLILHPRACHWQGQETDGSETVKQRLARAAILSHVETNEILHSPAISSSCPSLNFMSFQKFATRGTSFEETSKSHLESSWKQRMHMPQSFHESFPLEAERGLVVLVHMPNRRTWCLLEVEQWNSRANIIYNLVNK
jgi:hypothetical protein